MAFPRLIFLLVLAIIPLCNAQGLKLGYYQKTCPGAEAIVQKTTSHYISRAPTLAAPLLRMHFHDCFVRVRNLICFVLFSSPSPYPIMS